jgi:hypothetical protein
MEQLKPHFKETVSRDFWFRVFHESSSPNTLRMSPQVFEKIEITLKLFSMSWENDNGDKIPRVFCSVEQPQFRRNNPFVSSIPSSRIIYLSEIPNPSVEDIEQSFAPVSTSLHQCTPYTTGNNCKNSIRHFSKVAGYRYRKLLSPSLFQTFYHRCPVVQYCAVHYRVQRM